MTSSKSSWTISTRNKDSEIPALPAGPKTGRKELAMKIRHLIAHSHLVNGQYITVTDHSDRNNPAKYSTEGIGRYNFGPKIQEKVLDLKVNTFRPTEYGIHIDAE